MSSLNAEQQEVIDDMIRCGLMSIGQALHDAKLGIADLLKSTEDDDAR